MAKLIIILEIYTQQLDFIYYLFLKNEYFI